MPERRSSLDPLARTVAESCGERPDEAAMAAARARQAVLTKPAGALGRLEDLAVWLAGWQGRPVPVLERPRILLFVGWHGIAVRGVSAYPAEVTGQMLANFRSGGAAINQLAKAVGADLDVVPVAEDRPTQPFDTGPAATEAEAEDALVIGRRAVADRPADLLVLGEMGIGNTTAAAALLTLLSGEPATQWVGAGTGVDEAGRATKAAVIEAARTRLAGVALDPWRVLVEVGGHEIAAMAGALAEARRRRLPVVLDGFVVGAAAALLHAIDGTSIDHAVAGHRSAERGHARLLARLGLVPLLDLGLRLGEGSGAALAIPLLRAAVAAHAGMATFAQAGVSDRA